MFNSASFTEFMESVSSFWEAAEQVVRWREDNEGKLIIFCWVLVKSSNHFVIVQSQNYLAYPTSRLCIYCCKVIQTYEWRQIQVTITTWFIIPHQELPSNCWCLWPLRSSGYDWEVLPLHVVWWQGHETELGWLGLDLITQDSICFPAENHRWYHISNPGCGEASGLLQWLEVYQEGILSFPRLTLSKRHQQHLCCHSTNLIIAIAESRRPVMPFSIHSRWML